MFASPHLWIPVVKPVVASSFALYIGAAAESAPGYSGGNSTLSVNGSVDLPACLFVCGWLTGDGDPSTFQIGSTSLTKVTGSDTNVSLWVAEYAGGSDTLTYGPGTGQAKMGVASGWVTGGYQDTQISAQKLTYASSNANSGAHAHLSAACSIPSGGVGFVVAGTVNGAGPSENAPNWSGVETDPAFSDSGGSAGHGRISLACKSGAATWDPEFWGDGGPAGGWNFSCGMTACAFNT